MKIGNLMEIMINLSVGNLGWEGLEGLGKQATLNSRQHFDPSDACQDQLAPTIK